MTNAKSLVRCPKIDNCPACRHAVTKVLIGLQGHIALPCEHRVNVKFSSSHERVVLG